MTDDLAEGLDSWASAPSSAHWTSICQCLDGLEGDELRAALARLEHTMVDWPAQCTRAPSHWLSRVAQGGSEPRLGVVNTMEHAFDPASMTELLRLARSPDFRWHATHRLGWTLDLLQGPVNEAFWDKFPQGGITLSVAPIDAELEPSDGPDRGLWKALGGDLSRWERSTFEHTRYDRWQQGLGAFVADGVLGLAEGAPFAVDLSPEERAAIVEELIEGITQQTGAPTSATTIRLTEPRSLGTRGLLPFADAFRGMSVLGPGGSVFVWCQATLD